MFVLVIPKVGNIHIIDRYCISNGSYYTLCGKKISKYEQSNTLGLDNTIDGICDLCKESQDYVYFSDLEYDLARARNMFQSKFYTLVWSSKVGYLAPKVEYSYGLTKRWPKLNRYRKLVNRTKKYG